MLQEPLVQFLNLSTSLPDWVGMFSLCLCGFSPGNVDVFKFMIFVLQSILQRYQIYYSDTLLACMLSIAPSIHFQHRLLPHGDK